MRSLENSYNDIQILFQEYYFNGLILFGATLTFNFSNMNSTYRLYHFLVIEYVYLTYFSSSLMYKTLKISKEQFMKSILSFSRGGGVRNLLYPMLGTTILHSFSSEPSKQFVSPSHLKTRPKVY